MLELLKIYLNIDIENEAQDTQLNLLLTDAIAEFEEITNTRFDDSKRDMCSVVIQMAIIKFNRLGLQGLTSSTYAGATEHYSDGYPKELNRRIMSYKRLKVA